MTKSSKFPEGIISKVKGECIVLKGDDIDTDRIIPARFLKCVSFEALGNQVFADDRNELGGKHPFDQLSTKDASILIVNDNFGCGSSREHAPQALMRWGIRAIIGQSFAEIFYGNCLALGIPCATTNGKTISSIQKMIKENKGIQWEFSLNEQSLKSAIGKWEIIIEPGPLDMFLSGKWDATSQLISQDIRLKEIKSTLPYLNDFI